MYCGVINNKMIPCSSHPPPQQTHTDMQRTDLGTMPRAAIAGRKVKGGAFLSRLLHGYGDFRNELAPFSTSRKHVSLKVHPETPHMGLSDNHTPEPLLLYCPLAQPCFRKNRADPSLPLSSFTCLLLLRPSSRLCLLCYSQSHQAL